MANAKNTLAEKTRFEHDNETTDAGMNSALAALLSSGWNNLAIVRIDRIEIGDTGWRATYRP